jgi:thioesterase superfamily protein
VAVRRAAGHAGEVCRRRPGPLRELEVEARHLNPDGTLHGGVIYSLADTAMGAALFSRLEPGEQCAGTFYIQPPRS